MAPPGRCSIAPVVNSSGRYCAISANRPPARSRSIRRALFPASGKFVFWSRRAKRIEKPSKRAYFEVSSKSPGRLYAASHRSPDGGESLLKGNQNENAKDTDVHGRWPFSVADRNW